MNSRSKARRLAFLALYQGEFQDPVAAFEPEHLAVLANMSGLYVEEELAEEGELGAYLDDLLTYIHAHHKTIDRLLQDYMPKRPLARISAVERAILRLGVAEMQQEEDPSVKPVYIDEAVRLAKSYGNDDSYRFVNAVLDAILKEEKDESK